MTKPSLDSKPSVLARGNEALRQKRFADAIELFELAKAANPKLAEHINFNIAYAQRFIDPSEIIKLRASPLAKDNSSQKPRPVYEYQFRVEAVDESNLKGWAVNTKVAEDIFDIDILINDLPYITIRNDGNRPDLKRHKKSTGKGGVAFRFPPALFVKGHHSLTAKMPNGKVFPIKSFDINQPTVSYDTHSSPSKRRVTVIVPIYNAIDDVRVCIDRLTAYTDPNVEVILINDFSSDPEISNFLSTKLVQQRFIVVHNEENLGFTRTVNKGIELAQSNDVILLNSDARVTPRWIQGLQYALVRDDRIATVTAMSDRAGAFSAPNIGNSNDLPQGVSESDYAVAFRRRSRRIYPVVPTGNGFCMYIRREAIDEIGNLDEAAFPRGYGEENDFCMRARSRGWINIIDDATYVFHDRSKSFGGEKTVLIQAGRKEVDRRYPDYKNAIKVFSESPLIALARFAAKQAVNDCLSLDGIKPRALFVVATSTGGTPQTNRDLMLALYDSWEPWLLHCDSNTLTLYRVHLNEDDEIVYRHHLNEPVDLLTHTSFEYDRVVSRWLLETDFEIVHIRHLAWHSLSLPSLAKRSGARVINSFHDFYSLCPTVKLLDGDDYYCGGDCTKSKSARNCSNPLWKQEQPALKSGWINIWRERFQNALADVDQFITTSEHAKNTILNHLPAVPASRFHVINHGRNFDGFASPVLKPLADGDKIRVLIPGNINSAKGGDFIQEILRHDVHQKIEFHILGAVDGAMTNQFSTHWQDRIICHGAYQRDDFSKHVASIAPHVGGIFSIWDETWCHTLTELWASGIPALVLDFPTVAERVRKSQAGWVLPRGDAAFACKYIVSDVVSEYATVLSHVSTWQKTEGLFRNTRWMAARYHDIYTKPRCSDSVPALHSSKPNTRMLAVVCPSNQAQTDAPGSTYVRIWEHAHNTPDSSFVHCKMTPDQLVVAVQSKEVSKAIIQRTALSEKHINALIPFVKSGDFSYTFDLDDNLLAVPDHIDRNGTYKKYANTLNKVISNAAVVTVSTAPLLHELSKRHASVEIIPNTLSRRLWRRPLIKAKSVDFTVIYFGTKSHRQDFEMIYPALKNVKSAFPELKVLLIDILEDGYDVPDWIENFTVPLPNRKYPDFVEWLKEIAKTADIGIAPLEHTPFNAYKSNLKALEYAALALPVIASKCGIYEHISRAAPAIYTIPNDTASWAQAITECISKRTELEALGNRNREWVLTNHLSSGGYADNTPVNTAFSDSEPASLHRDIIIKQRS
ncbi:glycosyltransferase [Pseudomonas sp. xss_4]|uniref:glycosyltransferase n=1 Tax=Pseudomonas sp. xss_4 TaxID=3367216 RepID=UPI00370CDC7B